MKRLNAVNRKQALKVVKELDAFPKVPESYQETTATGGGLSIATFVLIGVLVMSEVSYYTNTELFFDYMVDTNYTGEIKLNLDITVAMKCHHIGADVLDQTGQEVLGFGQLKEDPVHWELSPKQQDYRHFVQQINDYLQEEYHAIQELMWKSGNPTFHGGMPERWVDRKVLFLTEEGQPPDGPHDACRIHGSLKVNKVAGNFHITAGKSVPVIPKGHAHLAMMMDQSDYNFSHRIDHFSFGEPVAGVIYPLDGTEFTTSVNMHSFQYFMKVVPTEVRTYKTNVDTYQFAVTEKHRAINHLTGSHGVPGIFVKYDLSSIMIKVREEHKPYWQFLIRLCGIIGGVFAVSGMINGLMNFIADVVCCRLKLGQYRPARFDEVVAGQAAVSTSATSPLIQPNPVANNGSSILPSQDSSQSLHFADSVDVSEVSLVPQPE